MDAWMWIVIIVVATAVVIALVAFGAIAQSHKRESERLRGDFGPEYDRAVNELGASSKANRELKARQDRVARLHLRALSADERSGFQQRWQSAQAHFVDEPPAAIADANRLVDEAMRARGYPVGQNDFDQRAADISVDHPYVIENYRAAKRIADANARGDATTEDLRQAMVHYRSLFEQLLSAGGDAELEPEEPQRVSTEMASAASSPSNFERESRTGNRARRHVS